MNVPWTLRFALAWAAIRHEFIAISVDSRHDHGTYYRFDLRPQSVRRWLARRTRMNSKLRRAREEERERIVTRLRGIHINAILDPDGAVGALGRYLEEIEPGEA